SEDRIRLLGTPAPPASFDYSMGSNRALSLGGFTLPAYGGRGANGSPSGAGSNPKTFSHAGAGGQNGWADPDARLAVAILRNKMIRAEGASPSENPLVAVGDAVRGALGLS